MGSTSPNSLVTSSSFWLMCSTSLPMPLSTCSMSSSRPLTCAAASCTWLLNWSSCCRTAAWMSAMSVPVWPLDVESDRRRDALHVADRLFHRLDELLDAVDDGLHRLARNGAALARLVDVVGHLVELRGHLVHEVGDHLLGVLLELVARLREDVVQLRVDIGARDLSDLLRRLAEVHLQRLEQVLLHVLVGLLLDLLDV